MGLGDADLLDDGDGVGGEGKAMAMALSCSIFLEAVMDNGDRSSAKLQCGHQFHLDCIGSAFNIKGRCNVPTVGKLRKDNGFMQMAVVHCLNLTSMIGLMMRIFMI